MINIDGIIVVEGRDDKTALKRVINSNIFVLNGMSGANQKKIDELKSLAKNNTIYLLTDPDFAGKKIREKINKNIENVVNLYAKRHLATKNKNIGIENLEDIDIIDIFKNIKVSQTKTKDYVFSIQDLIDANLSACIGGKERREVFCDLLSIAYCNSKQLVNTLNVMDISKEEFLENVNKIEENIKIKNSNAAIFGKFFPVHKGHVNFIKTASRHCKNLYVFVCEETKRDELINEKSKLPKLSFSKRMEFVKKELRGYKNVFVVSLNEDGINSYPNGWEEWTNRVFDRIKELGIRVDIVFSNEIQDKINYEKYFNKKVVLLDPSRSGYEVSSTMIRENPDKYREYMPDSVKNWLNEV